MRGDLRGSSAGFTRALPLRAPTGPRMGRSVEGAVEAPLDGLEGNPEL
jgi:hypothetical protein